MEDSPLRKIMCLFQLNLTSASPRWFGVFLVLVGLGFFVVFIGWFVDFGFLAGLGDTG